MKWKDKINKKYFQISVYVIITAIVIYLLKIIVSYLPVAAVEFFKRLGWLFNVIRPVILGFVIAYLMDPVVSFFEVKLRKLKIFHKRKKPRTWAAIISVTIVIAAVVGLISLLVFSVTNQARLANFDDIINLFQNFANSLSKFYESIKDKMDSLNIQSSELQKYVEESGAIIVNALKGLINSIISSLSNISGYLTTFIFSFIIGFYFIIDGKMITAYIKKSSKAVFSENFNKRSTAIIHDLDQVFSGYIRGQLTDAFVMMVLISLILTVTGVKFALVIGIFAGIGNLIPYFGPIIAYFSTTIVCLINGDIKTLIISLIALALIQFIDGNFIGPRLLSRSIKIHPLIIIISLIFGSAIGGFLGMLLAVPVGAYVKLVFVRFIDRRTIKKEELKKEELKKEEPKREAALNRKADNKKIS